MAVRRVADGFDVVPGSAVVVEIDVCGGTGTVEVAVEDCGLEPERPEGRREGAATCTRELDPAVWSLVRLESLGTAGAATREVSRPLLVPDQVTTRELISELPPACRREGCGVAAHRARPCRVHGRSSAGAARRAPPGEPVSCGVVLVLCSGCLLVHLFLPRPVVRAAGPGVSVGAGMAHRPTSASSPFTRRD